MLITLLSMLAAILLTVVIKRNILDDDEDFAGGGCFIFISVIITLILHAVTYPVKLERPVVTTTQKIVAMKTDSKTEGEIRGGLFFYRCRIDEVDYYAYLTEEDGIYRQEKTESEHTVIKETSGQPRIVRTTTYVRNGIPGWIRFRKPDPDKVCETDTIYVPEGTVSECVKFEVF